MLNQFKKMFLKIPSSEQESQAIRGTKPLPPLINADETMRGRVQLDNYLPKDGPGATCYLDLSVSAQGVLQGVEITHSQLAACCRSMKRALELYPSRKVIYFKYTAFSVKLNLLLIGTKLHTWYDKLLSLRQSSSKPNYCSIHICSTKSGNFLYYFSPHM